MEKAKCNISVRLSTSDKKMMKEISNRLCVKESELFRYAINSMLTKLMPLGDGELRGADLIPAWLECGQDLLSYFHIDVEQLDEIFNKGLSSTDQRVDTMDLNLMILSSVNRKYVVKKLSEVCRTNVDPEDVDQILARYLHEKYVSSQESAVVTETTTVARSVKNLKPSMIASAAIP